MWERVNPIIKVNGMDDGCWLMAGAGFLEKSTVSWLLITGLFLEKSTAGWWIR
jgi:hypothetical protein